MTAESRWLLFLGVSSDTIFTIKALISQYIMQSIPILQTSCNYLKWRFCIIIELECDLRKFSSKVSRDSVLSCSGFLSWWKFLHFIWTWASFIGLYCLHECTICFHNADAFPLFVLQTTDPTTMETLLSEYPGSYICCG